MVYVYVLCYARAFFSTNPCDMFKSCTRLSGPTHTESLFERKWKTSFMSIASSPK